MSVLSNEHIKELKQVANAAYSNINVNEPFPTDLDCDRLQFNSALLNLRKKADYWHFHYSTFGLAIFFGSVFSAIFLMSAFSGSLPQGNIFFVIAAVFFFVAFINSRERKASQEVFDITKETLEAHSLAAFNEWLKARYGLSSITSKQFNNAQKHGLLEIEGAYYRLKNTGSNGCIVTNTTELEILNFKAALAKKKKSSEKTTEEIPRLEDHVKYLDTD